MPLRDDVMVEKQSEFVKDGLGKSLFVRREKGETCKAMACSKMQRRWRVV